MGKWEREDKSWRDKQQVKFNAGGWLEKPEPPKIEQTMTCNPTEQVMCPFCLYQAQLSHFFVSTKKGISQGKAFCPECKNGMLMRTLLADMDAEAYAKFVFNYRLSGFWQKCPFDAWKCRLKAIGWSWKFWAEYKRLKGEQEVDKTLDGSKDAMGDYDDDYEAFASQAKQQQEEAEAVEGR